MNPENAVRHVILLLAAAVVGGCALSGRSPESGVSPALQPPVAMRPALDDEVAAPADADRPLAVIDLTQPGAVVWGSTPAEIIDTATFEPQIQAEGPWTGQIRRTREIVPAHEHPGPLPAGVPNALPVGGTLDEPRTGADRLFPGITQTAWIPPDPTLAVGPTHIVTTVNMTIAFFSKDGALEFSNYLGSPGNPGFFEPVGAGNFTFDPKCFYDHIAGRFVVLALEVYGSTQSWITIGVSDDSNPHGTWYKYRTNAVITVGSTTYWWDYPGLGYDAQGYYVTGNLFGLNQSGWAGAGFRVFDKTPLLDGQPAVYATLRDGGAASVQVAQHFGPNPAPLFVSASSGSELRIHAVTNPTTAPALVSTTVGVPGFGGPFDAPAAGGNSVQLIDSRIMNVHWRDGNLYACHHVSSGGRNFARWYHMQTNDWPASGAVTLVQSGNIDGGPDVHTWFPALYSNRFDEVGMVLGSSSETTRIAVNVTGRTPADPAGTMGAITELHLAPVNGGGRWGDFYDIAIDPLDDTLFWVIGEYPASFGWATWISSFHVSGASTPVAVPDDAGNLVTPTAQTIDVLANDYHTGDLPFAISSFDATSVQGGTILLSAGTGPGGRDELLYEPPTGYTGPDSFNYTITDSASASSAAAVTAQVWDPADFRDPDNPPVTPPGMNVAYYVLGLPTRLPDFSTMTPYATEVVPEINFPATDGAFAGSGRTNSVGAVFEGYVTVPADDVYAFFTESDDGSRLYIGTTTVVDNDGTHGMLERSGLIGLRAGAHAVRVEYFERFGPAGLIASIEGGGLAKQPIPPPPPADFDGDGDVDLDDFGIFAACYNGANNPPAPGCPPGVDADLDGDGDVDLDDFSLLAANYTGSL